MLLIGEGRLRGELEQYISENGLNDYVQLLGKRSDVANLYHCMDAFAFPSHFEGLGLVMIEAQASGLPCIASANVPRATKISDHVEYLGIEDKDIDVWCDFMLRAKEYCIDRAGHCSLVKNTKFNMDECVKSYLDLYKVKN